MNSAVAEMRQNIGPPSILVCFAGVVSAVPAGDMNPEEWRRVVDVNMTGSWFAAQSVAR